VEAFMGNLNFKPSALYALLWYVIIVCPLLFCCYIGYTRSKITFNPYLMIIQGTDEPEDNEFVIGNNTLLIVKTRYNETMKIPLSKVHRWYAGSVNLNIEMKSQDLYIPLGQIEYYKLINGK
jgi:hypothetical protein